MPNNGHDLTPEDRLKGGHNSKRKPLDVRMQEFLEEDLVKGDPKKGTIDEALRKALIKYGLKGSIQAIKEVYDRAYGKSKQPIDLSGAIGIQDLTREDIKNLLKKDKE